MTPNDLRWRVSIATLDRLIFPHPQNGTPMLALERKTSLLGAGADSVRVWAQPFGGAVRILNPAPLEELIGEIRFDSDRSHFENDFRILIQPGDWEKVKQFCLQHLKNADGSVLESLPDRELVEEFDETLRHKLTPDQYTLQAAGFVIENQPAATANIYASGQPTVRVYRIFEICVIDTLLCNSMLAASQAYSDHELGRLALKNAHSGGKGRANGMLALPLERILKNYLALAPEMRFQPVGVDGHQLDESVLAILPDVDVPQYERL